MGKVFKRKICIMSLIPLATLSCFTEDMYHFGFTPNHIVEKRK